MSRQPVAMPSATGWARAMSPTVRFLARELRWQEARTERVVRRLVGAELVHVVARTGRLVPGRRWTRPAWMVEAGMTVGPSGLSRDLSRDVDREAGAVRLGTVLAVVAVAVVAAGGGLSAGLFLHQGTPTPARGTSRTTSPKPGPSLTATSTPAPTTTATLAAPMPSTTMPPPSTTPTPLPVATFGTWTGRDPATVFLSIDGGNIITGLGWTWGPTTAVGNGTWHYQDCVPDCAQGTTVSYPATLTLSVPVDGQFTELTEVTSGPHGFTYHFGLPLPVNDGGAQ